MEKICPVCLKKFKQGKLKSGQYKNKKYCGWLCKDIANHLQGALNSCRMKKLDFTRLDIELITGVKIV